MKEFSKSSPICTQNFPLQIEGAFGQDYAERKDVPILKSVAKVNNAVQENRFNAVLPSCPGNEDSTTVGFEV